MKNKNQKKKKTKPWTLQVTLRTSGVSLVSTFSRLFVPKRCSTESSASRSLSGFRLRSSLLLARSCSAVECTICISNLSLKHPVKRPTVLPDELVSSLHHFLAALKSEHNCSEQPWFKTPSRAMRARQPTAVKGDRWTWQAEISTKKSYSVASVPQPLRMAHIIFLLVRRVHFVSSTASFFHLPSTTSLFTNFVLNAPSLFKTIYLRFASRSVANEHTPTHKNVPVSVSLCCGHSLMNSTNSLNSKPSLAIMTDQVPVHKF